MLLFYCAHCAKMIAADDSESTGQIVDRLNEHITECPAATFTYEGTSNVARALYKPTVRQRSRFYFSISPLSGTARKKEAAS
jgi:hypothetical protein